MARSIWSGVVREYWNRWCCGKLTAGLNAAGLNAAECAPSARGTHRRGRGWRSLARAWFGMGVCRAARGGGRRRGLGMEPCESRRVFAVDWPWQNPDVRWDIVPDGVVSPTDLLRLANELTAGGERPLVGEPSWLAGEGAAAEEQARSLGYLDATGDGWLTGADFDAVLATLEFLAAEGGDGAAEMEGEELPLPLAAGDAGELGGAAAGVAALVGGTAGDGLELLAIDKEAPFDDGFGEVLVGVEVPMWECRRVPASAAPIPTLIMDNQLGVHAGNWRPAWHSLNDLEQEGLIIDDYDSPYAAWGSRFNYTDDNRMVVPRTADYPVVDDSHFAWLEVVGFRSYYVGTLLENKANLVPEETQYEWTQTVTVVSGTTVTSAITTSVGVELGGQFDAIGTKLQASTEGSLTVSTETQRSETVTMRDIERVPPCSTVGLYKMSRVVEVLVDYVYMTDTVTGLAYGFDREFGRATIRSETPAGHRAWLARGEMVRVGAADTGDGGSLTMPDA